MAHQPHQFEPMGSVPHLCYRCRLRQGHPLHAVEVRKVVDPDLPTENELKVMRHAKAANNWTIGWSGGDMMITTEGRALRSACNKGLIKFLRDDSYQPKGGGRYQVREIYQLTAFGRAILEREAEKA
jgi:hypothetical protein